jgi:hypothetical protein
VERFIGYRPHPPDQYYRLGAANPPEQAQYEGVVFSDGTVVVRWLTEHASHSIWNDFETFYRIHGHPEYGTVITWLDTPEPIHSSSPQPERQAQRRRVPDRSDTFAVNDNCTRA